MSEQLTPMMRQYHATRRELPPDTLLLFRLGDFYEMFFEDAREASAILNVALTKRGTTPMCGVPYHAARSYIEKLIAAGKKVAICDQVGEVQQGKLVRRELTQILSAGSLDDFGLDEKAPNYLASICLWKNRYGLAWADLSTGDFRVAELETPAAVRNELARLSPAEIIAPEEESEAFGPLLDGRTATVLEGYHFEPGAAEITLKDHFSVQTLDGFGCAALPSAIGAAGALLHYLGAVLRRDLRHFRRMKTEAAGQFLLLDAVTQEHLELTESRAGRAASLLGAVDRTVTPMGARTLRRWLLQPLLDVSAIGLRQDAIAGFIGQPLLLADLGGLLGEIRDLERCAARLSLGSGNPRDLAALASSLRQIPPLKKILASFSGDLLRELAGRLHPLPELAVRLENALVDSPPALLRDGGIIREGFDSALDELRRASQEGKDWIASLQEREIQRTGIKSLKVRYTSVFGYFIEITKANLAAAPGDYVRKQTTVNSERFITPELKEIEGKILGADERSKALEAEIFHALRLEVVGHLEAIQETAGALGELDALAGLAETARLFSYARPVVDESSTLWIEQGRHPVLDARPGEERFVPNDTDLNGAEARLAIITGPNMAGKSTYIRQVALLVILAQTGSFIPAKSARIGLADRIFTRVGASDDLSRGQSTFMVEMSETANILNHATSRSLVILDEIGRGTSTFDGLSIAWSVAEYLHDSIGARTLFATHYHEITDLERTRDGVINLNVAVREWKDQIVFLRKIIRGRADQSYGIQVARLAGLPADVLVRAREILTNLEKSELNAEGKPALAAGARRRAAAIINQPELDLFSESANEKDPAE